MKDLRIDLVSMFFCSELVRDVTPQHPVLGRKRGPQNARYPNTLDDSALTQLQTTSILNHNQPERSRRIPLSNAVNRIRTSSKREQMPAFLQI